MDNEARLHAMRWAAATRLELNKGDKWERRRCELAVEMIDREFEQAALGFVMQDDSVIRSALRRDVRPGSLFAMIDDMA